MLNITKLVSWVQSVYCHKDFDFNIFIFRAIRPGKHALRIYGKTSFAELQGPWDEIIFKKIFGKSTKTLFYDNLDINLKNFAILQISMINDLRVIRLRNCFIPPKIELRYLHLNITLLLQYDTIISMGLYDLNYIGKCLEILYFYFCYFAISIIPFINH